MSYLIQRLADMEKGYKEDVTFSPPSEPNGVPLKVLVISTPQGG